MPLGFNKNGLDRVLRQEVFDWYRDGTLPLDERGVGFVLAHHYTVREGRDVAFEIGQFGDVQTSFSPDLDLLVIGDSLAGFEIKGLRGDNNTVTKQQLYEGLGQALTLLSQPLGGEGGALKHVCLACPFPETSGIESIWYNNFKQAVEETPIGLIHVGRDKIRTDIRPSRNPLYNPDLQSSIVNKLKQDTGSVRNPRRAFEIRAFEIANEHIDEVVE